MNSAPQLTASAAAWRNARLMHPIYLALAREFVIEAPACAELDAGIDAPSEDEILHAQQWFQTMDERIQVHQLRQFLQTTALVDNESLRILLISHLEKKQRTPADRDKIDFLLVQYFSHATPSRLDDADCDLDYVAQVLEPVLGTIELKPPDWIAPLEQLMESANKCHRLSELFNARLLEQGRKLKVQCGENYFLPVAMVAFTRFSFLMRRVFFRLMHGDLNAILDGLRELESRGVTTLDCRRAHFSHQEPTERLRMICHSWKVMFHAEYSSGQPLKMLADLRTVIEEVLTRSDNGKAMAATASSDEGQMTGSKSSNVRPALTFTPATSDAPEFDISAGQQAHGEGE